MPNNTTILKVFSDCVQAIRDGELIHRESRKDKEFHFQNWIRARLDDSGYNYEEGGRNSYPDFRIVQLTEGYEVKGLAYPGRDMNYDCNSQAPSGIHNGRVIYYVFGRYPKEPDGNSYPVVDLVICHGDFLNADHNYIHKNKSIKGFGSYGDIMIRDRKMYVAPTPFGIANGLAHTQTLILPDNFPIAGDVLNVGTLVRKEASHLIIGYSFDLKLNTLKPEIIPNPTSGREHVFNAWRLNTSAVGDPVSLRTTSADVTDRTTCDDEED